MLPARIAISKTATEKLRGIKGKTGVTPNVVARMALMLAIKDGQSIDNASLSDTEGQILPRDVLFGDHAEVYEALLKQYTSDLKISVSPQVLIASLIEIGVFKLGHVKKIQQLVA